MASTMARPGTPSPHSAALLRAIEGFSAATAGQSGHESTNDLLARVKGEIAKGHASEMTPSSVGKREANAAAQRNMPGEQGHSSGDGQVRSVKPDSLAHDGDKTPQAWAGHHTGSEADIHNAEGVATAGHLTSNHPSGGYTELARLRESAGARLGPRSGGQAKSNLRQPTPPASGRIGRATAKPIKSNRGIQSPVNFVEGGREPRASSTTANPREIGQEPLTPREPGFRGAEAEAKRKIAGLKHNPLGKASLGKGTPTGKARNVT